MNQARGVRVSATNSFFSIVFQLRRTKIKSSDATEWDKNLLNSKTKRMVPTTTSKLLTVLSRIIVSKNLFIGINYLMLTPSLIILRQAQNDIAQDDSKL